MAVEGMQLGVCEVWSLFVCLDVWPGLDGVVLCVVDGASVWPSNGVGLAELFLVLSDIFVRWSVLVYFWYFCGYAGRFAPLNAECGLVFVALFLCRRFTFCAH